MSERGRFYVYRIFDGAVTVYVGKGSGRRLQHQMRRFGLSGEVVEWCRSDCAAFRAERLWIKRLQPTENCNAGGGGGRVLRKKVRLHKVFAEIEKIGTRVYAARLLLQYCPQLLAQRGLLARFTEIASVSRA